MLVIISDLHLTDGSCGSKISGGAFDMFVGRLNDLAHHASWRADGTYKPVDRIDLILLGDVLDVIHSARWLNGSVRPWHEANSPATVEVVSAIVDDILQQNSQAIQALRVLAANGAIKVPPATQSGQPDFNAIVSSVPVRTHYMVGNRDWHLHLQGASYDLLRQKVAHHMGLANAHTSPFPHDPVECDELTDIMRRHRVFARHGDVFDPINFSEDRNMSSLGDAIVIELVNRFVVEVEQEMADDLPKTIIAGLRELENIRPLVMVPVWIDGMLARSGATPSIQKQVKQIWDRTADAFLQIPVVREFETSSPFDIVDGLAGALKFSRRLSTGWAAKIVQWLQGMRGVSSDSYHQHALSEQDFRNRRARQIVYGHTHVSEMVPLDASYADSFVLNQMYFNTGTWRRVYRPTVSAPGACEFIPAENMTYLAFFQGDERGGRPFESWTGTLGVNPLPSIKTNDSGLLSRSTPGHDDAHGPVKAPHFGSIPAVPTMNAGSIAD